ncbi:dermonecrotic toxin domain-containing protein [Burkholderia ubonensis]|uniref:dermonecrotic toxin domain-containing protein n=1 Tax=Burkholderia ubonensis TaxID=101571 RepID=UPI0012FB0ADC|nr:DUF6543 domain-containing protein [Burkholderia ubonensis]
MRIHDNRINHHALQNIDSNSDATHKSDDESHSLSDASQTKQVGRVNSDEGNRAALSWAQPRKKMLADGNMKSALRRAEDEVTRRRASDTTSIQVPDETEAMRMTVTDVGRANAKLQEHLSNAPKFEQRADQRVRDGASQHATVLPALASRYQQQLDAYWDESLTLSVGADTRRNHVANAENDLLTLRAALGVQDGTLSARDKACIDLLRTYPESADRQGQPNPPGAATILVNNPAAPGGKVEFSGMYVITERPISDNPSDTGSNAGVVMLVVPGRSIERFDSVQKMNDALDARLLDPTQRDDLLKFVPLSMRAHVTSVSQSQQTGIAFGLRAIQGNVFQNRVQSQIDQQRQDIAALAVGPECLHELSSNEVAQRFNEVADAPRTRNDLEPYLAERDQTLLDQANRHGWPDWLKNARPDEQAQLKEYESVHQNAQASVDRLMQDVASPHAYARARTQAYLSSTFGVETDPDAIQVKMTHTAADGSIQSHTASLTELVQEGPRDPSRKSIQYSVTVSEGETAALTQSQLSQALNVLDVRKGYSEALEKIHQDPETRNALNDVLDSQIQMGAYSAKLQGHLSDAGYLLVQRVRDPKADTSGGGDQVRMDALTLRLPDGRSDRFKDVLVFTESDASGAPTRHVLYAPGAPGGRDFLEFSSWRQLNFEVARWTRDERGGRYLSTQLDPDNRVAARNFMGDVNQKPTIWGEERVARNALAGECYRDKLGSLMNEKARTREAEAECGVSPGWYQTASVDERRQLTSETDMVRLAGEAVQYQTKLQPFEEFAHDQVQIALNNFLYSKGMSKDIVVDPDTVVVDLGDGKPASTLTDIVIRGYDSSINFAGSAKFSSSIGQNLEWLNQRVGQGSLSTNPAADYLDQFTRSSYLGDQYTKKLKAALAEGPGLDMRRAMTSVAMQARMRRDALESKLSGKLSVAQYESISTQIDKLSNADSGTGYIPTLGHQAPVGLYRFSLNGRPVEGVYVFRGAITEQGRNQVADALYTPDSPDGRTFRPYHDAAKALTNEMSNYYYQRVKYNDQPSTGTRLYELEKDSSKLDSVGAGGRVSELGREYDRRIMRAILDVEAITRSRSEVIQEQVWKGIGYAGTVLTLPFAPASAAFGAFMAGKSLYDGFEAYKNGDRSAALGHFLGAVLDAAGVAGDLTSGLKGAGGLFKPAVRPALLSSGVHFGGIADATQAVNHAVAQAVSHAKTGRSVASTVLDPAMAVKLPKNATVRQGGLLNDAYEGPPKANGFPNYYIKDGNRYFQVKPDFDKNTLRLIDPRRPDSAYKTPIRKNEHGQWEFNRHIGLRGGTGSSVATDAYVHESLSMENLTPVSNDPLYKGTFENEGRHYIPYGDPPRPHEVALAGKRLRFHADGQPGGPFIVQAKRNEPSPGTWRIDESYVPGPPPKKSWDKSETVEFAPMSNGPKYHGNLNKEPYADSWRADQIVNLDEIKAAIKEKYGVDLDNVRVQQSTGQEIAAKSGVPYDSVNPKSNPAAWTSPEGTIYIASDSPDYVIKGQLDEDKIRSTVIHEYLHAASHGHTGLQAKTTELAAVSGYPVNYDEAVVDYFAYAVHQKLYPDKPYKSGYFNESRSLWQGDLVRFLVASDTMSEDAVLDALLKNPSRLRPLEGNSLAEWRRWASS